PHSVLSLPPLRPPPSSTLFPYTTLFRSVGWITWLVWIAGIERYLTLLGRALLASPFRRAALRAKGAAAEHADVLRAYRSLRARQLPITIVLVVLGVAAVGAAALAGLPQEVPYTL